MNKFCMFNRANGRKFARGLIHFFLFHDIAYVNSIFVYSKQES